MSKEARALLKRINDMKNAIRGLQGQGKTQEMKDKMDQLREMQSEFDILMEMEDEDAAGIKDEVTAGSAKPVDGAKTGADKKPTKQAIARAFVNRIVCGLRRRELPEEDQAIMDMMTEADPNEDGESDGGFTVPQDIQTDIRELRREQLRGAIGQVQQDVFLFTGDISGNIRLLNEDITDAQIREAAREVNAARFIERLPNGYEERVTERGATYSAGQRQLLSFARTLAYDPKILILDEATSNIDTETEQWIKEAVHRLMQGRTAIMVAHRLSTIQDCDRIMVMHHGRIRETGTHQELLQQNGIYKRLYELQLE